METTVVGMVFTPGLVLGLLAASICAVVAGIVFVIPGVLAAVGRVGKRRSVGVRLAIRDLSRYRSRTAAGLAAISLALGVAVTVVLVTSAALYASAAEGNLADSQLMVRIGEIPSSGDIAPIPERTAGEVDRLEEVVNQITQVIGGGDVTPVEVVVAPEIDGFEGLPAGGVGRTGRARAVPDRDPALRRQPRAPGQVRSRAGRCRSRG